MADHLQTDQLMLRACLSQSKEGQEALVRKWEAQIVMDDMPFSSMRLVPLFLHSNQGSGISTKYDNRLKIIYKHWWLKTQHILNQLKTVHAAFFDQGIEAIVIKGAAIMSYYEKPELRPMADFDLLIQPAEINSALKILALLGYSPDKQVEGVLIKNPSLITDFVHSIECIHSLTGTKIDLHWRIGSLCSAAFSGNLRRHAISYGDIPNAKKPALAYEVFMIIIHAVIWGGRDNSNWIIDIALLNLSAKVWDEARELAIIEKKELLFDYGCTILLENSIDAPTPVKVIRPKIVFTIDEENGQDLFWMRLYAIKTINFFLYLKYLFPHKSLAGKFYQGLRRIRLFLIFRRSVYG